MERWKKLVFTAQAVFEEWILKGDSLGSDLSVGSYTVGQFSEGQCYTGRQFIWGHFTGGGEQFSGEQLCWGQSFSR